MEKVVGNLILENQLLARRVARTEFLLDSYINWNKNEKEFYKYVEKQIEDRNRDNLSDK